MRDVELREERLEEAFRAAAVLEAFRDQPEPAGASGQGAARYSAATTEIQQVLEILCHRERANSVMLVGEPGVGKTAIAEGSRGASSSSPRPCRSGCATARSSTCR